MSVRHAAGFSRREFLGGLTLAGTMGLLGIDARSVAAEPPPETTRLRLVKIPNVCLAPQYIAEDLLRAEGFADLEYIEFPGSRVTEQLGSGAIDITQFYSTNFVKQVDAGAPVVFLSGVHTGCQELVAGERVRTIADLKGKTIAIPWGIPEEWSIVPVLSYIGLDYRKDVHFVEHSPADSLRLVADGKIDAFMAAPPFAQEARAQKTARVVLNTTTDRPWSQYFCCMVVANKEFVRKHPVATKRALRAILKADQICATEPERVARVLVEGRFTKSYDYAVQALREVPYGHWRQYDPEDTVRFYALRLHEAGGIKSSPAKIIAQGTDWRFLNEVKKELKG